MRQFMTTTLASRDINKKFRGDGTNMKVALYLAAFLSLSLTACASFESKANSARNDMTRTEQAHGPSAVVQTYWSLSLQGETEKVSDLVRVSPGIFLTCYFDTPEQCQEKLARIKKEDAERNTESGLPRATGLSNPKLDDAHLRRLREQFPQNINQRQQFIYKIAGEWIKGDQARVRIIVKERERLVVEDVLLFKENERWQIFELVAEGERPAYATPDKLIDN